MANQEKVYIGELLRDRMTSLGLSIDELSFKSFVDKEIIIKILNNNISFNEIEYWDIDFISQCVYCTPEFFTNEDVRKRDIIYSTGQKHPKVATVMAETLTT